MTVICNKCKKEINRTDKEHSEKFDCGVGELCDKCADDCNVDKV